jgi:hypothetical protein
MSDSNPAPVSNRSGVESTAERLRRSFVDGWLRVVLVGVSVGILGGMGTFSYTRIDLSPFDVAWLPLVFVALAGAYAHVLSVDMRSGTIAMVVGFVVGGVTNIVAWISPVYFLSFQGPTRQLALLAQLQQSLISLLMVYLIIYLSGYFSAVSISGAFS